MNDVESLSDSDESFQPEVLPENDGNGDGVIVRMTEMEVRMESIELSGMQTPSMSESTRNLNQDFGGADENVEVTQLRKSKG